MATYDHTQSSQHRSSQAAADTPRSQEPPLDTQPASGTQVGGNTVAGGIDTSKLQNQASQSCLSQLGALHSPSRRVVMAGAEAAIKLIQTGCSEAVADTVAASILRPTASTESRLACLYAVDATLNQVHQLTSSGGMSRENAAAAQEAVAKLLPSFFAVAANDAPLVPKLSKVLDLWHRSSLLPQQVLGAFRTQIAQMAAPGPSTVRRGTGSTSDTGGGLHKSHRRSSGEASKQEAANRVRRMFGSESYLPTQSARGWLEPEATKSRLREAGFRIGGIPSEGGLRPQFEDHAGGHVPPCNPEGVQLWQHGESAEGADPEHLEGLIEGLLVDVRRRTMQKRAVLQRLFERAEADEQRRAIGDPSFAQQLIPGLSSVAQTKPQPLPHGQQDTQGQGLDADEPPPKRRLTVHPSAGELQYVETAGSLVGCSPGYELSTLQHGFAAVAASPQLQGTPAAATRAADPRQGPWAAPQHAPQSAVTADVPPLPQEAPPPLPDAEEPPLPPTHENSSAQLPSKPPLPPDVAPNMPPMPEEPPLPQSTLEQPPMPQPPMQQPPLTTPQVAVKPVTQHPSVEPALPPLPPMPPMPQHPPLPHTSLEQPPLPESMQQSREQSLALVDTLYHHVPAVSTLPGIGATSVGPSTSVESVGQYDAVARVATPDTATFIPTRQLPPWQQNSQLRVSPTRMLPPHGLDGNPTHHVSHQASPQAQMAHPQPQDRLHWNASHEVAPAVTAPWQPPPRAASRDGQGRGTSVARQQIDPVEVQQRHMSGSTVDGQCVRQGIAGGERGRSTVESGAAGAGISIRGHVYQGQSGDGVKATSSVGKGMIVMSCDVPGSKPIVIVPPPRVSSAGEYRTSSTWQSAHARASQVEDLTSRIAVSREYNPAGGGVEKGGSPWQQHQHPNGTMPWGPRNPDSVEGSHRGIPNTTLHTQSPERIAAWQGGRSVGEEVPQPPAPGFHTHPSPSGATGGSQIPFGSAIVQAGILPGMQDQPLYGGMPAGGKDPQPGLLQNWGGSKQQRSATPSGDHHVQMQGGVSGQGLGQGGGFQVDGGTGVQLGTRLDHGGGVRSGGQVAQEAGQQQQQQQQEARGWRNAGFRPPR